MTSDSPPAASAVLGLSRLRPAYEQVADQLRQLILVGDLKPGDQLPVEARLCEIFGVSRSTVREAVRLLAAQDLIHTTRGVAGGSFVSPMDAQTVSAHLRMRLSLMADADAISVDEMLEARELLEVPAASLAAERASGEQIAALQAAADSERQARFRPKAPFDGHREFHQLLVEASGNRLLSLMNTPNFQVLQARFTRGDMPAAFWAAIDEDHRLIAQAVANRDRDAAASTMTHHLHRLHDLYRELP